jgi:hypothetical protein
MANKFFPHGWSVPEESVTEEVLALLGIPVPEDPPPEEEEE